MPGTRSDGTPNQVFRGKALGLVGIGDSARDRDCTIPPPDPGVGIGRGPGLPADLLTVQRGHQAAGEDQGTCLMPWTCSPLSRAGLGLTPRGQGGQQTRRGRWPPSFPPSRR